MVKGGYRSLGHKSQIVIVAIMTVVVLHCLCTPAWSKTETSYGKRVRIHDEEYTGAGLTQPWVSVEVRKKEEVMLARERGRGRSPRGMEGAERSWRDYETLSPEEKARLNRRYREWKSLPPEKQELLRRRMKRWDALPPDERSLYERRFHQWQSLSPEERERIRERLNKWNDLPHEEKEKIRRRFHD